MLEMGRKLFWFMQWSTCAFVQDVLYSLIEGIEESAWRKKQVQVLDRAREILVLAGKAERIKPGMRMRMSEMRDAYALHEVVCNAIKESGLKLSIRQLRNRLDKAIAGRADARAKREYKQLNQFFERLYYQCWCKHENSTFLMCLAA